MSLLIVALTTGFFLLLMLRVYIKEGREKKPSRDEMRHMDLDEENLFLLDPETEDLDEEKS